MYEYINILSNLCKYVKRILCILSSNVIYEIKVYYYYTALFLNYKFNLYRKMLDS